MRLAWDKEPWLPKVLELNRACFSGVQRAPDAEVSALRDAAGQLLRMRKGEGSANETGMG